MVRAEVPKGMLRSADEHYDICCIDKQFWCVAHGASYWPRWPHCREADKVLASFSKLQKKLNLSEPEAKELKKLAKRVDQFALTM
eukprot:g65751.t1